MNELARRRLLQLANDLDFITGGFDAISLGPPQYDPEAEKHFPGWDPSDVFNLKKAHYEAVTTAGRMFFQQVVSYFDDPIVLQFIRSLGSHACWRFAELDDLVRSKLWIAFSFPDERGIDHKRFSHLVHWLRLICGYEPPKDPSDSLTGQPFRLFQLLKSDNQFVSFRTIIDKGVVNGDFEAVRQAIKRLKDRLRGNCNSHTLVIDNERVRLIEIRVDD